MHEIAEFTHADFRKLGRELETMVSIKPIQVGRADEYAKELTDALFVPETVTMVNGDESVTITKETFGELIRNSVKYGMNIAG